LVLAIASAADLVGVDDKSHGKRVAIMAKECGKVLGLAPDRCEMLYEAGLLHDCGVSSTRTHRSLITELDWAGSRDHCERGYAVLAEFRPLSHLADIVRYHHTHWDELQGVLVGSEDALFANLIYLVDRVDMLAAPYYPGACHLFHTEEIRRRVAGYAGSYFCPRLVEAFLEVARNDAFWLLLTPEATGTYVRRMAASDGQAALTLEDLRRFAAIFANIVDAKSPYTKEHSEGVARLSRLLGSLSGLGTSDCDKLEIAALLHDIGKLQVPDEILEKPSSLDARETTVMRAHSFATFEILRPIEGIEDIAEWAAHHHEAIDGSGYPFGVTGEALSLQARIIRVADIFQAMAQVRPYRVASEPAAILAYLVELAAAGKVDRGIVALLQQNLDACHLAATAG
jgi:putative nucleotidyltransferase with HDIG domain